MVLHFCPRALKHTLQEVTDIEKKPKSVQEEPLNPYPLPPDSSTCDSLLEHQQLSFRSFKVFTVESLSSGEMSRDQLSPLSWQPTGLI